MDVVDAESHAFGDDVVEVGQRIERAIDVLNLRGRVTGVGYGESDGVVTVAVKGLSPAEVEGLEATDLSGLGTVELRVRAIVTDLAMEDLERVRSVAFEEMRPNLRGAIASGFVDVASAHPIVKFDISVREDLDLEGIRRTVLEEDLGADVAEALASRDVFVFDRVQRPLADLKTADQRKNNPVYGSDWLAVFNTSSTDSTRQVCTAGFAVRHTLTGAYRFLTAGHCDIEPLTHGHVWMAKPYNDSSCAAQHEYCAATGNYVGTIVFNSYQSGSTIDADVMAFTVPSGWPPQQKVMVTSQSARYLDETLVPGIGMSVCHGGAATKWSRLGPAQNQVCGPVNAVGVNIYHGGISTIGLRCHDVWTRGGDSGGTVWKNKINYPGYAFLAGMVDSSSSSFGTCFQTWNRIMAELPSTYTLFF